MRSSIRPVLGALLALMLLASFSQAPVLADSSPGPFPPIPDDSIPAVDSNSPPENPGDGIGLVAMILIIILPVL